MEPRADPTGPDAVIDVTDEAEVRRWAEKLTVSVEALHRAIGAAGPRVRDVGEHLLRSRADDHRPLPGRSF